MRVELPHDLLMSVTRPGRYTGGEQNSTVKDHALVSLTFALAFPDTYEVGMSHLGLHILYQELNRRSDTAAERVFAPWVDMEQAMRARDIPLHTLESRRPVREFDLVGFSLQYELQYTNVLLMLDLAGIPRRAADREDGPLICAGGPCAVNPEPVADLFDFIVLGDGEEVVHDVVDCMIGSSGEDRGEVLARLSRVDGVYVPGGYEVLYEGDRVSGVSPGPDMPVPVRRRIVTDLGSVSPPDRPVVPLIQAVHDRAAIELFRGCSRGCRFCQAGFTGRPVRERSLEQVCDLAHATIAATGYEEASLLSLSSSDYSGIEQLCDRLGGELRRQRVSLSLPSLRVDKFSVGLAGSLQQVRKSGLTFAPEAGTERLRRVINKGILDEELMATAVAAWQSGWDRLKLYFMIGLPTETEEDVAGIIELVRQLKQRHREGRRSGEFKGRGLKLAVSVATFVPKPHTPFQWVGQLSSGQINERLQLLRSGFGRKVDLSTHDPLASRLEAVLARGDRRLLPVIERAYELGSRFDAWTERWRPELWDQAFRECGVDPARYAERQREPEEVLPWDHLDVGVDKEFLWNEFQRALSGDLTPGCRQQCMNCGITGRYGAVCGGRERPHAGATATDETR